MKNKRKSKKRKTRKNRFVLRENIEEVLIAEVPDAGEIVEWKEILSIYDRSKKKYLKGAWDSEHAKILIKFLNRKSSSVLRTKLRYAS